jgi:hypothetical protein
MDLVSVFCRQTSSFSAPFVEEAVFSPSYIFDDFVESQVGKMVWIHIWVLYSVSVVFISVFVPVPCCFLLQSLCSIV